MDGLTGAGAGGAFPDQPDPDRRLAGWADLAWAFDRWKAAHRTDDAALCRFLRIPEEALSALATRPRPITNADVDQLCAAFGCDFECLVDLLWDAANWTGRRDARSLVSRPQPRGGKPARRDE